jgi:AcrR family transcriptional regulator
VPHAVHAAPPRSRAAGLNPDERRRVIVDATLPLVLERGASVTTREIAEASGIAEGTIFRVFPDKDALLQAVVERALDTGPLEARLAEIDRSLPLDVRLTQAVAALQERTTGMWQLASNVGGRRLLAARHDRAPQPVADLPALIALFEGEQLRYDAVRSARRLRALAASCTHPALSPEPLTPEEIVSFFLDGVRA